MKSTTKRNISFYSAPDILQVHLLRSFTFNDVKEKQFFVEKIETIIQLPVHFIPLNNVSIHIISAETRSLGIYDKCECVNGV